MNKLELANKIEHTNLNPQLPKDVLDNLIKEAIEFKFRSICITPAWVSYAKKKLQGTGVLVITVPNWEAGGGVRLLPVRDYAFKDADEIDYIWDIYRFAGAKNFENTAKELEMVRKETPGKLKIIIESTAIRALVSAPAQGPGQMGYTELIEKACSIVDTSGADYIKTDSGLFVRKNGFTDLVEDVTLIKKFSKLPIKASAGIKFTAEALKLLDLGVSLLGTSAGVQLLADLKE